MNIIKRHRNRVTAVITSVRTNNGRTLKTNSFVSCTLSLSY